MLKTVRSEKMYMNDDALVAAVELSHKVYGHSSYLFSCPLHSPSVIPTGIPIAHPSCVSVVLSAILVFKDNIFLVHLHM